MKKAILACIILSLPVLLFAQNDDDVQDKGISHYILPAFVTGIIKKRSGQLVKLPLNYNTVTEEMVFTKDTQLLAIANVQEIDTVYLADKVFVPVKTMFYQRATNTTIPLYVQHKAKLIPPGTNIGFGSTTETGTSSDLNAVIGSTQVYKLALPTGYKTVMHHLFYLYANGKFAEATNLKKIQSIFPAKADAIKAFVQTNKTRFNNMDDMVKLINFCNE